MIDIASLLHPHLASPIEEGISVESGNFIENNVSPG
jgi:hypothetical protein